MCSERGIEGDGALLVQHRSGAVVDGGRSHQTDTAVAVIVVVPVEELLAVSPSVLDRAEAIGEVGSVLQGFELRLGVRIVIRHVRAAVCLGDIEVDEERSDGLRSHAGATIGMERQGAGSDVFLLQSIGNELLGEFCGLPMRDQPTNDVAAVDVEDHIEMEAGPFGRALHFRSPNSFTHLLRPSIYCERRFHFLRLPASPRAGCSNGNGSTNKTKVVPKAATEIRKIHAKIASSHFLLSGPPAWAVGTEVGNLLG